MQNKFSSVLQQKAVEMKKEEEEQERLRKKYQVEEPDVKIIKTNMFFRSLADMTGRIVRILCIIMIFLLAAIGAVGILYPAPREALIQIGQDLWSQVRILIG